MPANDGERILHIPDHPVRSGHAVINWEEETSETICAENRKKFGTIHYDEEIAFKIDDYLVTYYFAKDKFLARVIRGGSPDGELPDLLP